MEGIVVFVYGTLLSGFWNHERLKDPTTEFLGTDTLEGKMYGSGIPIIDVLDVGTVHGELYRISKETLQRLDQLEGYHPSYNKQSGYVRVIVKTHSGVETYVYSMTTRDHHEYQKMLKTGTNRWGRWENVIESGDYRKERTQLEASYRKGSAEREAAFWKSRNQNIY